MQTLRSPPPQTRKISICLLNGSLVISGTEHSLITGMLRLGGGGAAADEEKHALILYVDRRQWARFSCQGVVPLSECNEKKGWQQKVGRPRVSEPRQKMTLPRHGGWWYSSFFLPRSKWRFKRWVQLYQCPQTVSNKYSVSYNLLGNRKILDHKNISHRVFLCIANVCPSKQCVQSARHTLRY